MRFVAIALMVLRVIPFINTQLFIQAQYRGSRRRHGILLQATGAGLVLNAVTLLCLDLMCFSATQPGPGAPSIFQRYHNFITLNGSYQDFRAIVISSVICMGLSYVYGLAARFIFRSKRSPVFPGLGNRALGTLLVVLWLPFMLLGAHIAYHGVDHVRFSEFARLVAGETLPEASVASNPAVEAGAGDSYVCLFNDGELACTFEPCLAIEGSSDRPVSLGMVRVPARGAVTCALRYGRDLRLKDSVQTTVLLVDEAGRQIDSASVPALEEGEARRREPDSDTWRTYRQVRDGEGAGTWAVVVPAPAFSAQSGFYDAPFELTVSAEEGCRIYYTLDGSIPGEGSLEYTGPLSIRDASLNENHYSMRTDISVGYSDELIRKLTSRKPLGYRAPDFLVDKCTVVRAVSVDSQGNSSDVISHSYFVDFNRKSGYAGMNIISMILDPEDLFGYEDGIYVTGKAFDEYLPKLESGKKKNNKWWWWHANYRKTGPETERGAWMEFFDSDRSQAIGKQIGIRLHGNSSRGYIPRGFNLFANRRYDDSSTFGFSLDASGFKPQKMILFAGGNAFIAKLEDYLMSRFVPDRRFATMNFVPCALFLNGEYWGNYWLTEKYDKEYIAYHYGVDRSDIVMVKNNQLAEGEEKDMALYEEMTGFIAGNDMSVEENYERACEMLDIDSYIDYYAAQAYISRTGDWPVSNFALWRTRSADGGVYSDGRWRWMLFDDNGGSFSSGLSKENTIKRLKKNDKVFASLMANETFERRFVQTLRELAVDYFTDEKVGPFISDYIATMSDPFSKEFARFYGSDNTVYEDRFLPRVKDIETFLYERHDYILNYCDKFLARSSQSVDNAEGGN